MEKQRTRLCSAGTPGSPENRPFLPSPPPLDFVLMRDLWGNHSCIWRKCPEIQQQSSFSSPLARGQDSEMQKRPNFPVLCVRSSSETVSSLEDTQPCIFLTCFVGREGSPATATHNFSVSIRTEGWRDPTLPDSGSRDPVTSPGPKLQTHSQKTTENPWAPPWPH